MEVYERVENVKSREDLITFINHLRVDLQSNRDEWENITLEDFLEAMEAWINDMEGYYLHSNQPIPKQPSWKTIADILYASSMYE
ncbi:hypothetical protein Q9R38_14485 [Priestia aryabhattai]|uniref:DUF7660 family protein n=1 Tax=Priestia aryabhattai TaxID=412384 RepID=UPI002882CBB2|nr:hypothetical protein [Priestia aryabhattai]MDT0147722.1 hypothetical protein [Priestia aryabhattai]MDT0154411.1 hypothetical protein [Priestia aryabhattai]MED4000286.1 hypothetical protein [Priestia aryabhattai]